MSEDGNSHYDVWYDALVDQLVVLGNRDYWMYDFLANHLYYVGPL